MRTNLPVGLRSPHVYVESESVDVYVRGSGLEAPPVINIDVIEENDRRPWEG